MVDERNQVDIVEDAFAALRQSQPPQGPSLQALEQTLRAVRQAQSEPPTTSLFERLRRMDKVIKYPVGVAAAAVFLALATWWVFPLRTNDEMPATSRAPRMGDFSLHSFVFSEGLAAVVGRQGRIYKTGYIDKSGKWIIEPQFSLAGRFSHGIARVQADANGETVVFYIDRTGKRVDENRVPGRRAVLQSFERGGKYGYKDASTGQVTLEAQWDEAGPFSEGVACVKLFNAGGSRYIDETGRVIIPPDNFTGREFHNGLAVAAKGGRDLWGFIDHSGRFVIEPKFTEADAFSEGLAHVQLDGRHGFIDTEGNVVVPLKFREASRFAEGLAAFRVDPPAGQERHAETEGDWGYIDRTGKVVIPAQFRMAGPFSEGLAAVMRTDGTLSFIDVAGKDVIKLAAGRGNEDQ